MTPCERPSLDGDDHMQGVEWLGLGGAYGTLSKINPIFDIFCVTVRTSCPQSVYTLETYRATPLKLVRYHLLIEHVWIGNLCRQGLKRDVFQWFGHFCSCIAGLSRVMNMVSWDEWIPFDGP
jgi:hypothetical protein